MEKLKNVWLVDDDSITNFINMTIISDIHITENIQTAENGLEALEMIKSYYKNNSTVGVCSSLVFLDLNMPLMDGFEFLQVFGNMDEFQDQCIPIIVVTSSENAMDIERAKKLNINGYVCKPLTPEKVNKVLSSVFA